MQNLWRPFFYVLTAMQQCLYSSLKMQTKVVRSVSMKESQVLLATTKDTSTQYAFTSTGSSVRTSNVFPAIERRPYQQSRHLVIQSVPTHVHFAPHYCRTVSSMASTIINQSKCFDPWAEALDSFNLDDHLRLARGTRKVPELKASWTKGASS